VILECTNCNALVDGEVLYSYAEETSGGPPCIWFFSRCPKCKIALLAAQEDYGGEKSPIFRVYPPGEKTLSYAVPDGIKKSFVEAQACFKAQAFTACALMCRKTLEGICVHHSVKSRALAAMLKELKDQGLIEARLFEWADALRMSGNEAAHDTAVVISSAEARDLIEFTEALIEYLFTYRDKFESFKRRRNAKRNKSRD
jgi:hypothetical protein